MDLNDKLNHKFGIKQDTIDERIKKEKQRIIDYLNSTNNFKFRMLDVDGEMYQYCTCCNKLMRTKNGKFSKLCKCCKEDDNHLRYFSKELYLELKDNEIFEELK